MENKSNARLIQLHYLVELGAINPFADRTEGAKKEGRRRRDQEMKKKARRGKYASDKTRNETRRLLPILLSLINCFIMLRIRSPYQIPHFYYAPHTDL
jgi:hypothetical protein